MSNNFSILFGAACLLSAISFESEAAAQDTDNSAVAATTAEIPPAVDTAAPSGSNWEFSGTIYMWGSGLSGDVGVFPALPPVEVDLSFGDVLDNLDFAGMAALQARKGRFVALADVNYVDLGASKTKDIKPNVPGAISADLDTSTFTSTITAGYRVVDEGPLFFDILAGIRISSVDTKLELGFLNQSLVADSSETWVDPVVMGRFRAPLGERWAFAVIGDIGGFGVSSDLTWQLLGTVQYRIGRNMWLATGWRYYSIDYDKDGFVYDVTMNGPVVGFTFGF